MTRVLLLTAGFGEGHNAAARNLAAALDDIAGPGTACIRDPLALTHPRLNELARRIYLGMINRTPKIWQAMYKFIDLTPAISRRSFIPGVAGQLERLLAQERPDVVCSTYPVYTIMLSRLARAGRWGVPYFTVVTDSISINSVWWCAPCDGWFLPNADTESAFLNAGIAPDRLHVAGFPVPMFFRQNAGHLRPPDLNSEQPRVLQIVNSGTQQATATAKLLLADASLDVTCVVGRNDKLRRELEGIAAQRPATTKILGWTDQIPYLLMTHHLVISKAGGATTQEAIAAGCPMIVSQVVPGQEEGNYELLRRHNAGIFAGTPQAVFSAVKRAVADRGALWAEWRANLSKIARSDGAEVVARHLLASRPAETKR